VPEQSSSSSSQEPLSVSVKIRLMRVGKKKQPTYRVVVADERSPRDGRIIETIGHYGPRADPSVVDIDSERALDWLRKGAQPSEAVQKLLTTAGVWATFEGEKSKPIVTKLNRRGYATGKHTATKMKKKPQPEAAAPAAEAPADEAAAEAPADEAPAEATADEAPSASAEAESEAEGAPAEAVSADAVSEASEGEAS
jgi:small subunit ribosomal protein S16